MNIKKGDLSYHFMDFFVPYIFKSPFYIKSIFDKIFIVELFSLYNAFASMSMTNVRAKY